MAWLNLITLSREILGVLFGHGPPAQGWHSSCSEKCIETEPNISTPGPTRERPNPRLWLAGVLVVALGFAFVGPAGAATEAEKPPRRKLIDGKETLELGFSELASFPFKIVDVGTGATPAQIAAAKATDQVPGWLRAYDGRRVVLTGFMLPLQLEDGLATKFFLMKDVNSCCYGATPNMNDYVSVSVKGKGVKVAMDVPVRLLGVFHIEQKYDADYVVSLFEMSGERLMSGD